MLLPFSHHAELWPYLAGVPALSTTRHVVPCHSGTGVIQLVLPVVSQFV